MNILQKICFVLLLTTFSSVYGWDCFKDKNIDNCSVKAEQGNAESQYHLGVMYQRGDGVFRDYNEAVKWYRKSAEQGLPQAQYNLGLMYEKGESVFHDVELAHMWFSLASSKGHADAVKQIQELESKMTLSEIKEAKESARNWKPLE